MIYSKPLVSICTVTHNRSHLLPLLQDCISKQTYPHELLEWVIVDDSTDRSERFLPDLNLDFSTSLVRPPKRLTLGAKRNASHKHCRGEVIVYMDDDDWYPPTRVEHAVSKLYESGALIAGSTCLPVLLLPERELWLSGPFGDNHATANTFAFKRELLALTQYDSSDAIAEEKKFLLDYTLEMVQLEPKHTILCIGHSSNTFDKRKLKAIPQHTRFRHLDSGAVDGTWLTSIAERYEQALQIQTNRPRLVYVAGPWGSGSTAVTGALKDLGLHCPGPYFKTNDPRTSCSFEMKAFRDTILGLVNEADLRPKATEQKVEEALQIFIQNLIAQGAFKDNRRCVLKLPAAALILPQIFKMFSTHLIISMRSIHDIEATRRRRKWPAYLGKTGAERIYRAIFTHVSHSPAPVHLVRYEDLTREPKSTIESLAKALGMRPDDNQFKAAIKNIRKH